MSNCKDIGHGKKTQLQKQCVYSLFSFKHKLVCKVLTTQLQKQCVYSLFSFKHKLVCKVLTTH